VSPLGASPHPHDDGLENIRRAARRPAVVLTTGLSRVTWGSQHRRRPSRRRVPRVRRVRRGDPLAADTQGR